jgi:hypothetical protein
LVQFYVLKSCFLLVLHVLLVYHDKNSTPCFFFPFTCYFSSMSINNNSQNMLFYFWYIRFILDEINWCKLCISKDFSFRLLLLQKKGDQIKFKISCLHVKSQTMNIYVILSKYHVYLLCYEFYVFLLINYDTSTLSSCYVFFCKQNMSSNVIC